MADVAARAGVSRPTVSLVFRGATGPSAATKQRVLRAAEEIGYYPDMSARLLRRQRSKQLGVVFAMRQPFEVELVEHIYPAAQRHGYGVVLGAVTPTRDHATVVEELLGYRCEAMILLEGGQGAGELASRLPVVQVACAADDRAFDVIRSDDADGIQQAVDHLVGLGHRRIVHVDGGTEPSSDERRRGYEDGMRRHGLPPQVIAGAYTEEAGARAAAELVAMTHQPTAVITSNDRCALGLLDHLVRAGVRVPDDMSVVGYDDSSVARLPYLNLTTIRQDAARLAELGVEAVVRHLDTGDTDVTAVTLTPHLVVRGTTAPPPTGLLRTDLVRDSRRQGGFR